jgi:hypothetical protein
MNEPNDTEFEAYLARRSPVSEVYRTMARTVPGADQDNGAAVMAGPSAELDARILAMARASVDADTSAAASSMTRRRWAFRVGAPLALAASLIFAVVMIRQPDVRQTMESSTIVKLEMPPPQTLSPPQVAAPSVSSSPVSKTVGAAASPVAIATQAARDRVPPPGDSLQLAAEQATVSAPPAAQPVAAPAPAPEIAQDNAAANADVDRVALRQRPASQAKEREAAASASGNGESLQEVVVSGSGLRRSWRPGTVAAPALAAADTAEDPAKWLTRIRGLRLDNRINEADEEWRKFQAAWPDYSVATNDSARPAGASQRR